MASTSRASRVKLRRRGNFRSVRGKKKEIRQDLLLGEQVVLQLTEISGEMTSYLFRQFFQFHKSYEYAVRTRNVQLWHYKGK